MIEHPFIKNGKQYAPFVKPIAPLFSPLLPAVEKQYDVLLNNGFHIYDRKGQHLVIKAALEYRKLFGKDLKIAMVGTSYRNTETRKMFQTLESEKLDVYRPGCVDRNTIKLLANQSRLHVHLGCGDSEPRSALESMACGIPLYLATPSMFAPWFTANEQIVKICKDPTNSVQVAKDIHWLLDQKFDSGIISEYFQTHGGIEKSVNLLRKAIHE